MIVLKIIFSIMFLYYILVSLAIFSIPYTAIYRSLRGDEDEDGKRVSLPLLSEIILILILLVLALLIDEESFIFNIKDTFIWVIGILIFVWVHLISMSWVYSFFRKK